MAKVKTPNNDPGWLPKYEDPGPKPESGLVEKLKWRQRVRRERKKLRKDLKLQGIKSRYEFEEIARELGLSLDDGKLALLFRRGRLLAKWIASTAGLKTLALSAGGLLAVAFMASSLTEYKGSFTINLTADMMKKGFVLSSTVDFSETTSRIETEEVKEVTNITLEDIAQNVDLVDGSHNGTNYIAYTFYIRNDGEQPGDYIYKVNMLNSTKQVDSAVWIMLFEDGHQLIYAKAGDDGKGEPEGLYGYRTTPPFYDSSYSDLQYYTKDGSWGIVTTPYADDEAGIVAMGTVSDVEPGEVHKYTVVIWVEGYDPECTNDIFGGFAKYSMVFSVMDQEDDGSIFAGVYRTEYEEYDAVPLASGTEESSGSDETESSG